MRIVVYMNNSAATNSTSAPSKPSRSCQFKTNVLAFEVSSRVG